MSDAAPVSSRAAARAIGAILLAAGSSSRLGEPKQLLSYRGRPLVARAADVLVRAGLSPVVVVLGAHAEKIRHALAGLPVIIVENSAWTEGMGASIRAGITALEEHAPTVDGALVALCDQPHFSTAAVDSLRAALNDSFTIAATRYGDNAGVPAIFLRQHFPALHALTGVEGARGIISAHRANVARIDLPALAIDIDTAADWVRLEKKSSS